jgi:hypothetical protein
MEAGGNIFCRSNSAPGMVAKKLSQRFCCKGITLAKDISREFGTGHLSLPNSMILFMVKINS